MSQWQGCGLRQWRGGAREADGIGEERGVWNGEAAEKPTDLTRPRCRTMKHYK